MFDFPPIYSGISSTKLEKNEIDAFLIILLFSRLCYDSRVLNLAMEDDIEYIN
jgi:hypothetical protein